MITLPSMRAVVPEAPDAADIERALRLAEHLRRLPPDAAAVVLVARDRDLVRAERTKRTANRQTVIERPRARQGEG